MYRLFVIFAFIAGSAAQASAELRPAEIAVVAARGSSQSQQLAKYYIEKRGLPAANLCLVDMPKEEVCPHEQWLWAIRPEIRKWIAEHDPNRKLRCLVTVWDVPLKIAPAPSNEERRKYRRFLEGERRNRLNLLSKIAEQLDQLASAVIGGVPVVEQPLPSSAEGGAAKKELATRQAKLEAALQSAQARISRLPQGETRNRAAAQLQQWATLAGGARVLLQGIERQLALPQGDSPELKSQFDLLRGRAAAFAEMKLILDQLPLGYHHDALVMATLERNAGLLGTIEWLDEQLMVLNRNETGSAFDNELALVMWPDDYELLRWQPNYLRASYDNSQLRDAYRTLMVARLDAPTLALAKGLVDAALATEAEGLQGKAYFDARGVGTLDQQDAPPGSYADYDRSLLGLAKALDKMTRIDVTLNTGPQLFKAGECPNAALYCGWYSLAKYVDAFDWSRGAVGYHLASGEAATLREPGSQAWCKKMIEDGVAATIGPVYEPYLAAFPRPDEFFALLVQGELTLAECYWRTQPFTSWMMTLIGDPLYRPYKNNRVVLPAAVREASSAIEAGASDAGGLTPGAQKTPSAPAPGGAGEAGGADRPESADPLVPDSQ